MSTMFVGAPSLSERIQIIRSFGLETLAYEYGILYGDTVVFQASPQPTWEGLLFTESLSKGSKHMKENT